jgi:hypothetical protein
VRAVAIPNRPTVTELSRGQNKVREVALSPAMQCNETATWCKLPSDKFANFLGIVLSTSGVFCIVSLLRISAMEVGGWCGAHSLAWGADGCGWHRGSPSMTCPTTATRSRGAKQAAAWYGCGGGIMGPEKYEDVGKYQSVLITINPIISPRTRSVCC